MSDSPRRRTRTLVIAGAAAAVAVPAIAVAVPMSVAQSAPPASSSAPAAAAHQRVKLASVPARKLLRQSDLPRGWKSMNVGSMPGGKANHAKLNSLLAGVTLSPTECKTSLGLVSPAGARAQGHRVFKKGSSMFGPYLGELVVRFDTAARAAAAMDTARSVSAACSHVTIGASMGSAEADVTPMSVPALGDESIGYQIDATVAGFVSAEGQVILTREGRYISAVAQAGMTVSSAATKSAARKAVRRL